MIISRHEKDQGTTILILRRWKITCEMNLPFAFENKRVILDRTLQLAIVLCWKKKFELWAIYPPNININHFQEVNLMKPITIFLKFHTRWGPCKNKNMLGTKWSKPATNPLTSYKDFIWGNVFILVHALKNLFAYPMSELLLRSPLPLTIIHKNNL